MNPLQMLGALQKAQNPMALLSQLSGQNPQLKRVMEVMNGKSPQELKSYVQNVAKTQGVDLNELAHKMGLQLPQAKKHIAGLKNILKTSLRQTPPLITPKQGSLNGCLVFVV